MPGRGTASGLDLPARKEARRRPPRRRGARHPRFAGLERKIEEQLARGETDPAATTVIQGYGPSVLAYLCTLLPQDDARDAFSMFAEDLWRSLRTFRRDCTARAWAYRIAWHAAARYLRDPYRVRRERLPTTAASRLAASMSPRSVLRSARRCDRLGELREMLGPEERTLLVLRIDKELDWSEIAAVLSAEGRSISPVALRKRFERLKDKLERLARREGFLD